MDDSLRFQFRHFQEGIRNHDLSLSQMKLIATSESHNDRCAPEGDLEYSRTCCSSHCCFSLLSPWQRS